MMPGPELRNARMNNRLRISFMAALCVAFIPLADAQRAVTVRTISSVLETSASRIVLPSGVGSTLVLMCPGCTQRSFVATAKTKYFIGEKEVTLAEMRARLTADPDAGAGVEYSVQTGELVRVIASSP